MTDYEYGIDYKKLRHREETPHRTGMTKEEAEAWFVIDAGDSFDWNDVFVIVRRQIGDWEDLPAKVDPLTFKLDDHKPGCRCMRTSPPFAPEWINTDIIGKDCQPNSARSCACGSSAGANGSCGPNGCYNIPG